MKTEFAAIMTALLVLLMAGSAMCATTYDSSVVLENKDGSWQPITTDDITAVIEYSSIGEDFAWYASGVAKIANTEYSLIYYADKPNRFEEWGGNNPGALIGTFTTEADRSFSEHGYTDLGMDMPHVNDFNADPDPNYCNNNNGYDSYDNCRGAKLWIVPTAALPDPYPGNGVWAFWGVDGILFETDLITYTDCDDFPDAPPTATFSIDDAFGVTTVPIMILNATNAGSVDMTLTYDASIVTVTGVSGGDMDSEFWNIGVGQVRIGAYQGSNPGLDGGFVLAHVSFEPVTDGSCNFGITVTTYKDATPCGTSMPCDISTGVYSSYLNGDVNGDGVVDMFDAMYLAKHVVGISGFGDIIDHVADVDGDGVITINDAAYLARYVIGITGYTELK